MFTLSNSYNYLYQIKQKYGNIHTPVDIKSIFENTPNFPHEPLLQNHEKEIYIRNITQYTTILYKHVINYIFKKSPMTKSKANILQDQLLYNYKQIQHGTAVGAIASQSIASVVMQSTLDQFHSTGSINKVSNVMKRIVQLFNSKNKQGSKCKKKQLKSVKITLKNHHNQIPNFEANTFNEIFDNILFNTCKHEKFIKRYIKIFKIKENIFVEPFVRIHINNSQRYFFNIIDKIKKTKLSFIHSHPVYDKEYIFYIKLKQYKDINKINSIIINNIKKINQVNTIHTHLLLNNIVQDIELNKFNENDNIFDNQPHIFVRKRQLKEPFARISINKFNKYKLKINEIFNDFEHFHSNILHTSEPLIIYVNLHHINDINKFINKNINNDTINDNKSHEIFLEGNNKILLFQNHFHPFIKSIETDDIQEIFNVYGIEACKTYLFNNLKECVHASGANVNIKHLQLVVDAMTYTGNVESMNWFGFTSRNNSPLALASFERSTKSLANAAMKNGGTKDQLKGISERICTGSVIHSGSGQGELFIDIDCLEQHVKEHDPFIQHQEDKQIGSICIRPKIKNTYTNHSDDSACESDIIEDDDIMDFIQKPTPAPPLPTHTIPTYNIDEPAPNLLLYSPSLPGYQNDFQNEEQHVHINTDNIFQNKKTSPIMDVFNF